MKPVASSKRAKLPRECEFTNQFHKDWQALSHSGRYDIASLKLVMMLLIANDAPLGPEWLDHALKGEWSDHRECHIGGDFLLIYRLEQHGKRECIRFVRAGTHAQLFGM
jgi:mRNA interferase YafQ